MIIIQFHIYIIYSHLLSKLFSTFFFFVHYTTILQILTLHFVFFFFFCEYFKLFLYIIIVFCILGNASSSSRMSKIYVSDVTKGTQADRSVCQINDMLVAINNHDVTSMKQKSVLNLVSG